MTFSDDPNRDDRPRLRDKRAGMSWGLPLAVAAVALLLGFFVLGPRESTNTAANNSPNTTQRIPAPTTASPAPQRPTGG